MARSSILPTWIWSTINFEKPSLAPRMMKKVPRVTMKLGRAVRLTIVPFTHPNPRAIANDSGSATHRLSP